MSEVVDYEQKSKIILEKILASILENNGKFPEVKSFIITNRNYQDVMERMTEEGLIHLDREGVILNLSGLVALDSEKSKKIISYANQLIPILQEILDKNPSDGHVTSEMLSELTGKSLFETEVALYFLYQISYLGFSFSGGCSSRSNSGLVTGFRLEVDVFKLPTIETAIRLKKEKQRNQPKALQSASYGSILDDLLVGKNEKLNLERAPEFSRLTSDEKIIAILINRWNECELCVRHNIPLAAIVMVGSFIETLLFVKWESSGPFKKSQKPNNLNDFLIFAVEQKWINNPTKEIGQVLRQYRNFIHPDKEIANDLGFDQHDAVMFWNLGKGFAHQILKNM